MKALDFIQSNIGTKVYLVDGGDLRMGVPGKYFRVNEFDPSVELTIVKLTKGGMAYLLADDGVFLSVPPSNVREVLNA